MIGLSPWALAPDQNSNAPKTLPWSVIAIAGIPRSAVRANMSSSRAAPSSMEYSVWPCRWTKSPLPVLALLGTGLPAPLDARLPTGRADEPDHVSGGKRAQPRRSRDLSSTVTRPTDRFGEPVVVSVLPVPYDVARVRAAYPSLAAGGAHFDGPGGSQTPLSV